MTAGANYEKLRNLVNAPNVDALKRQLGALTARERVVLEMRYGLDDGGPGSSFRDIAEHFGLTPERIRQLEAQALKKLGHVSRRVVPDHPNWR